jgi:hypothetical protein
MNSRVKVALAVGVVLILQAAMLLASDPVGIYCIVDKVIFEPSESSPQRIQVWGTFALWKGEPFTGSMEYSAPQCGYMYYAVAGAAITKVEHAEWMDLKAIAGTGQGVAFGQRYKPTGRVRSQSEKPDKPDPYPLGVGLTKVGFGGPYTENMTRVIGEVKKAATTK